jgi:hypothetical protein
MLKLYVVGFKYKKEEKKRKHCVSCGKRNEKQCVSCGKIYI